MLEYRSVAALNSTLLSRLDVFREKADLVVGVPRSGMLPAILLALHLHVPVTDLDSYCRGIVMSGGVRLSLADNESVSATRERRVLVIDDSLDSGAAMDRARTLLHASIMDSKDTLTFAAVYIRPGQQHLVDIWCEELPNRLFEWNILNNVRMSTFCVDIDGVLCRDPTGAENDDGPKYERFLSTVSPLRVPSFPIGWLVSCRLEKYRALTEAWLRTHGVKYHELVLLDLPSKEARIAAGVHSKFKAAVYEDSGAALFIESDSEQAREIAAICGKPVFCSTTSQMVYHKEVRRLVEQSRRMLSLRRCIRSVVPPAFRPWASRAADFLGLK